MPKVSHPQDPAQGSTRPAGLPPGGAFTSLATVWRTMAAHRRFVLSVIGGMPLLCLLYCLIDPKQYDAKARVALHSLEGSSLNVQAQQNAPSGSASAVQGLAEMETIANVLRGDKLAWCVIVDHKLYGNPAFRGSLTQRFPGFKPEASDPEAREYLLKRFHARLQVSAVPRTLLVEIRFRSKSPQLSAEVVNALIVAYDEEQSQMRGDETRASAEWLQGQLALLKQQTEDKERQMEAFKQSHGLLLAPSTQEGQDAGQGLPELVEVNELTRELAAAASERILREVRYKEAMSGAPELVLDTDTPSLADDGSMSVDVFKRLHARRVDVEQELAQLSLQYGPNYEKVAEDKRQLVDVDAQLDSERGKLREMLRKGLEMARQREDLLNARLAEKSGEGQKATDAVVRYQAMALEAAADEQMYVRIQGKVREAGFEAGIRPPDLWVVDPAVVPGKPAVPDLPLYMAITLFVSVWVALGGAMLLESLHPRLLPKQLSSTAALLLGLLATSIAGTMAANGQAPIPNTQGLPTGVTKVGTPVEVRERPDPRTSPQVWNGVVPGAAALPVTGTVTAITPAALGPGDVLDVSELHAPEFHSTVRVSEAGAVVLPMIGEIKLAGLNEAQASSAIAAALVEKGILLHPQVFVLVTASAGQDVSVLGEVTRPGVYPFTVHHRMLDLIAAASGLSPTAGGVVGIFHRADPNTPHIVTLRGEEKSTNEERNPELLPGDTVQVSRAGLVYVVGGVMRPGGFAMDPQQRLTVLQALSLAWGPSQSAAAARAVLIREQSGGGRLVTALNLKRMLRGKDPDVPLRERDILFIPDSLAKNIWNHSLESVIQSAAGVSLYSGLVYSQRY